MPVATGLIRALFALIISIPFFFSYIYYLAANAIEDTVLKPSYLIDTLDENDVYNRVYEEFLVEPELDDWVNDLIGGFALSNEKKAQLLRQIIPPDYIRTETERNIASLVSYLNNESDDLELFIEAGIPIENIKPALLDFIEREIDSLDTSLVATVQELARETEAFLASVAAGGIPSRIPTFRTDDASALSQAYTQAIGSLKQSSSISPEALARLEQRESDIDAALSSGVMRAALSMAAQAIGEAWIDSAVARLQQDIDEQGRFDIIDQLAEDSDRTREEVMRDANTVRSWGRFGIVLGSEIALVLAGLSILGMGLVFVPYWKHVMFWPGATLLLSGLLFLVLGWLLALDFLEGFATLCDNADTTTCSLSLDIARSFATDAGASFITPSIIILSIGFVAVLLSILISGFTGGRSASQES